VTPIVPICAHTAPWANACAAPSPKITDSTTSAVGSMVITTRPSPAASRAVAATWAPALASGAVAWSDRSHTVVRNPAASRLRAIAEPMMPVPSTATVTLALIAVPSPSSSPPLAPSLAPGLVSGHHTVLVILRVAPPPRRSSEEDGAAVAAEQAAGTLRTATLRAG
jgi:hypothetical protein